MLTHFCCNSASSGGCRGVKISGICHPAEISKLEEVIIFLLRFIALHSGLKDWTSAYYKIQPVVKGYMLSKVNGKLGGDILGTLRRVNQL